MKLFSWFLIICLGALMIGCSSDTPVDDVAPTNDTTATLEIDSPDLTLVDKPLIESLQGEAPSTYILEVKTEFIQGEAAEVKISVLDDYMKVESKDTITNLVTTYVYDADNKTLYKYCEDEDVGTKSVNCDNNINELLWTSYEDFSRLDIHDFEDMFGSNYTAKNETYKGQDAIFVVGNFSDDSGDSIIRMWYSKESCLPLRAELFTNQRMILASRVIRYNDQPNLTAHSFNIPSHIQFNE